MKFRELQEPLQDLVIFLLTISLPSKKQDEIHGIGLPGLEMPEYLIFDVGYKEDLEKIKKDNLLSLDYISKINEFVSELKGKEDKFWMEYETLPEWDSIRTKANSLYKSIGLSELEIITQFNINKTEGGIVEFSNLFVVIEKKRTKDEMNQAILEYKNDMYGSNDSK